MSGPAGAGMAPSPHGPSTPQPLDDPRLPLYTVGQVADLLGVQQPFLRRIEAQGLVTPGRSEGGQRRYSRDDIAVVNGIVDLVADGCTLSGVRRILQLQAELAAVKAELATERAKKR